MDGDTGSTSPIRQAVLPGLFRWFPSEGEAGELKPGGLLSVTHSSSAHASSRPPSVARQLSLMLK